MKVRQRRFLGDPARQRFEIEQLPVGLRRPIVHLGQHDQRMSRALATAGDLEALGVGGGQQTVDHQLFDHETAGDPPRRRLYRLHALVVLARCRCIFQDCRAVLRAHAGCEAS